MSKEKQVINQITSAKNFSNSAVSAAEEVARTRSTGLAGLLLIDWGLRLNTP